MVVLREVRLRFVWVSVRWLYICSVGAVRVEGFVGDNELVMPMEMETHMIL
jgi:hypothetical protein